MDDKQEAAVQPSDSDQRGIQSVEVGGRLLEALTSQGAPMALKHLARAADMAAAKAHPYLVSFGRLGLVTKLADGRYALGPLALEMGLISLRQASPVAVATPHLAPLALQIRQTLALAVWGAKGPTIVRVEESPEIVFVSLRHGTVFSLSGTASGRLFAAHLDPSLARRLLEEERGAIRKQGERPRHMVPSWRSFQRELAEVRRTGLGRSVGDIVAGINALAAPVFGAQGEMVLALIAIGPGGSLDTAADTPIALALRKVADGISRRLGGQQVAT